MPEWGVYSRYGSPKLVLELNYKECDSKALHELTLIAACMPTLVAAPVRHCVEAALYIAARGAMAWCEVPQGGAPGGVVRPQRRRGRPDPA